MAIRFREPSKDFPDTLLVICTGIQARPQFVTWLRPFFHERLSLTTDWQQFQRSFTANDNSDIGYLEFQLGEVSTSPVYIDDVLMDVAE